MMQAVIMRDEVAVVTVLPTPAARTSARGPTTKTGRWDRRRATNTVGVVWCVGTS